MSGRKQFDPDAALDRAVTVFWRLGYSATSINDLVAATGLGRGSLYATFGDKQHLFIACLRRYTETVGSASRTALSTANGDARSQILSGYNAILDRMDDPTFPAGCLLAQTAAEAGALDPSIQGEVRRILDDQISDVRHVLEPWLGDDTGTLDSLASYVVTVAQALAVMHRAGRTTPELRAQAEHALQALAVALPS